MKEADEDLLRIQCRTMQIIAFAMLMGVATLLGVTAFIVMGKNQPAQGGNMPIISMLAVVFLVINVPLSFVLPRIVARNSVRQLASAPSSDTRALLTIRQTTIIISRALLEGVGFLGCIAFMVEMHWIGFAVAIIVVVLMLLTFPTLGRTREWVEWQERALEEMRMQR